MLTRARKRVQVEPTLLIRASLVRITALLDHLRNALTKPLFFLSLSYYFFCQITCSHTGEWRVSNGAIPNVPFLLCI